MRKKGREGGNKGERKRQRQRKNLTYSKIKMSHQQQKNKIFQVTERFKY